jgi:Tfp pilus assembly protein PilO
VTVAGLKRRERWLLGVAVGVAVVVLGDLYIVEPLVAKDRATRELIIARQGLLARQERLVARQAQFAAELSALEAEIGQYRRRLLPGGRAPLAASELQKLVKTTAQEAGVEVRSERILPSTERGAFTEVPIEVTLAGPIRALATLLARLEAAPVILTISDVRLRVVSVAAPRELSATFSLAGYIPGVGSGGARPGPTEPGSRPGA